MCIKYVNASARCYKSIRAENNHVISYHLPFDSIRHEKDGSQIKISQFAIVTDIDFLGTGKEEHKADNPLESKKTLDFVIRLTKCSSEKEKRIGYDLDCFSVNLSELSETDLMGKACFDFLNYTRTTLIDSLTLPGGIGRYVIKVLVKDSEEETYTIQSMTQFHVL